MIRIRPTTASGLSSATYGVDLPNGEGLDMGKERPQSVATTLSGGGVITTWAHSIEGHVTATTMDVTETDYQALRLVTEHSTVFEWVVAFWGRTFNATLSIVSAVPSTQNGKDWQITLRLTIVRELHRG